MLFPATKIGVICCTALTDPCLSLTGGSSSWLTGWLGTLSPAIILGNFGVYLGSLCYAKPLDFFLTSDNLSSSPPHRPPPRATHSRPYPTPFCHWDLFHLTCLKLQEPTWTKTGSLTPSVLTLVTQTAFSLAFSTCCHSCPAAVPSCPTKHMHA